MLLGYFKQINNSSNRNRMHRIYVITTYMCNTNSERNITQYHVPSMAHTLCQRVWLGVWIVLKRTFYWWKSRISLSWSIISRDHVHASSTTLHYKGIARDGVSNYVETIAAVDGLAFLVHVRREGGHHTNPSRVTYSVIVLPRRHGMPSLLEVYNEPGQCDDNRISLNTFPQIMKTETTHIRVSMRVQGICDTCFIICERVRTLSLQRPASLAEDWHNYFDGARRCANVYLDSPKISGIVHRNPFVRLRFVALSYDVVRRLNLAMMWDQKINEYFPKKEGFEVNIFTMSMRA